MSKKAAPEKKKHKSIKRPERGVPKLRLSLHKTRQITAAALVRKEAEEFARKTRAEQNAALEAKRKEARDVERARYLLSDVAKRIRAAADDGRTYVDVFRLGRDDLDLVAGVHSYSPDALIGPARHVYEAMVREGYAVTIVNGEGADLFINARWQ